MIVELPLIIILIAVNRGLFSIQFEYNAKSSSHPMAAHKEQISNGPPRRMREDDEVMNTGKGR
jgi:hypothetical protein